MVDVRTEATAGGGRFELSPPDESGRVRLVVVAPETTELLVAGITGFIAAVQSVPRATLRGSDRSISIRAEAKTVGQLFIGLTLAVLDRMESFEIAVASASVDGIVRTERGHIAWGRLEIAEGVVPNRKAASIITIPIVEESSGQFSMQVSLGLA